MLFSVKRKDSITLKNQTKKSEVSNEVRSSVSFRNSSEQNNSTIQSKAAS